MKFQDEASEELYNDTPDDQVGDSSEGIGWAGLYLNPKDVEAVASVLVEHTDGVVERFNYDTEEEMRDAWATFERSLDIAHPNVHREIVVWTLGEGQGCLWTVPLSSHPDELDFPPLAGGFAPDVQAAKEAIVALYEDGESQPPWEFWKFEDGRFYLTDI